ncbi:MAG: rhodanese-like domain-containing protein [Sulfurovum sp.]|nr:rhodanese-like domain-containing protein [Sulfurovum sp.]
MIKYFSLFFVLVLLAQANQVNLTPTLPAIDMTLDGKKIHISRMQDSNHKLRNEYTLTSRLSPPFEIQPYSMMEGIETISELEVFDFIQHKLKKGALLIDARLESWFYQSSIPAAINIPFPSISAMDNNATLERLGILHDTDTLDFSQAKDLLIFDNGPWCPQATLHIEALVTLGYPKEKIIYYRGGMQYWSILGLIYAYPKEVPTNKGTH